MQNTRWVRRHLLSILFVGAVIVTIGLLLYWWYWPSVPTRDPNQIQSIEVHLSLMPTPEDGLDPHGQDELRVTTTDRAQIRAVLEAFRNAERASDHKCGQSGTIRFRRTDGATEEVEILPGHDLAYYEYRYGSRINRVPRGRMLAALKVVGATRVKLEPP